MSLSDAYEETVLDHILGTAELTFDATVFLALGTDAAPDKSTFTECNSAAGYARQAVTFAAASGGVATNSSTATFGSCSGTAWGTLKSFAIYDTSSAGTRVTQGSLTEQTKVVGIGDSATVAAGAVTVTAT